MFMSAIVGFRWNPFQGFDKCTADTNYQRALPWKETWRILPLTVEIVNSLPTLAGPVLTIHTVSTANELSIRVICTDQLTNLV